ncbi:MAG: hypothetical protein ABGZ36_06790 [Actinomycetota bacterium]
MTADARPNDHAVIAHVGDAATAEAAVADLAESGVDRDAIAHGTGESFAARLEAGDEDSHPAGRLVKFLLSLGQEREELMRLGEEARSGRHAIVVNDVEESHRDAVADVLARHDARDIVWFGDWQTEDLSIQR